MVVWKVLAVGRKRLWWWDSLLVTYFDYSTRAGIISPEPVWIYKNELFPGRVLFETVPVKAVKTCGLELVLWGHRGLAAAPLLLHCVRAEATFSQPVTDTGSARAGLFLRDA